MIGRRIKFIVFIAVLILLAIAVWYYRRPAGKQPTIFTGTPAPTSPPVAAPAAKPSLGSQLYEQSKNPVQGKLPNTVSPVPNPIQGIYKNPFQ